MIELGYALSSEEHDPNALVENARLAEEAGFAFALISDHYHPWVDRQGHSPFVWSVVGGIAPETERLQLRTGTAPDSELVERFEESGGAGKPRYGQVTVCWARCEEEGRRIAREWWPNVAIEGDLSQELPLPEHFEQASANVSEEDVAGKITCGPDPERHVEAIRKYEEAGFDHVYVHQIGPDQEGFFGFYEREVLPRVAEGAAAATRM